MTTSEDAMPPDDRATDPALLALRDAMRRFAAKRDWDQFHSPRNLATALAVEVAELLEPFQWLGRAGPRAADRDPRRGDGGDGHVLRYLVRLADKLDVDLEQAARDKIARNSEKYSVEKARGTSRKYDEL